MGALGGSSPPRLLPKTMAETVTGHFVDLAAPCQTAIRSFDIAYGLAGIHRYNGQAKKRYTVAQHSVLISHAPGLTQDQARWGLLHDAHEAYIGDMTRPVYWALVLIKPDVAAAVRRLKEQIDRAIIDRFRIAVSAGDRRVIHGIDQTMLLIEAERLFSSRGNLWDIGDEPSARHVYWDDQEVWDSVRAETEFLKRMEELELEL